MAGYGPRAGTSIWDLGSRDGRPGGEPDREAAAQPAVLPHLGRQRFDPLHWEGLAVGEGQLCGQLDHRRDALRLGRPVGVRGEVVQALMRVRIAPPNGKLREHRLREQLDHRDPSVDLALGGPLGLVPVAAP